MKYGFSVLFKGKKNPIAQIFKADSNNKAHSLRKSIISKSKDIVFVSRIEKEDKIQLPLGITTKSVISHHPYFEKQKEVKS